MKLPKYLKVKCPSCGAALRVTFYRYATFIGTRKCKCGLTWMVKAEAREFVKGKMYIHAVSFVAHDAGGFPQ